MTTPLAHSAPSSSSSGGMTLEAIMVQLQRIIARLNILTNEMSQVTTHVGRIARRQARLGGFIASPHLSPKASEDEDEDASSSSDEEMTASQ